MAEHDYEETVKYILNIPLFAQKIGRENLAGLLARLGNPERTVPCIHVAGTNGKGSTCCALAQMLSGMGYKVGLFTSPHLVSINERIRVDGELISDEDFVDAFETVRAEFDVHPSFFEVMFAMAAVYFRKQGCDFAVYETGMGGRLDATNVLSPEISVITSVGMDHMEYLGDTIEKIAAEKAGIIKPGVPVVYFRRDEKAAQVIEEAAAHCGSPVIPVEKNDYIINHLENKTIDFSIHSRYYSYCNLVIPKVSLYQVENITLAVTAFSMLMGKSAHRCSMSPETAMRRALANFCWEGRMEELAPHIYVDGAHNVEAIRAYIDTMKAFHADARKILVFAAVKDKQYDAMIELLSRELSFRQIIVTSAGSERRADTSRLAGLFEQNTDTPVCVCESVCEAMDVASELRRRLSGEDGDMNIYCVGSLYLVGGVKRWLAQRQGK